MIRKFILNCGVLLLSLCLFYVFLEIICRVFFPDPQLFYDTDPELLARLAPNQKAVIALSNGEHSPEVILDELGFRIPEGEQSETQAILLLGDSFTFGWGVKSEESFPELIESHLDTSQDVINAGHPGYGMHQFIGVYERYQDVLLPKHVGFIIWEGSILRQPMSETEKEAYLQKSYKMKRLKRLSLLGTYMYRRLEKLLAMYGGENYIVALGEGIQDHSQSKIEDAYLQSWRADSKRLSESFVKMRERGQKPFIVLWPSAGFVPEKNPGLSKLIEKEISSFAASENVPFLSLQNALSKESTDDLIIPLDWHPTAYGHCIAAKEILRFLERAYELSSREFHCTK